MNQSAKSDLLAMDAVELASLIPAGELSPVEAVAVALERLDAVEPHINAFSHVMREQAMADAQRAQAHQATGAALPPLFGVPVSVKDLIAVADAPLRFGSRLFADSRSELDAPAVARLRAAGAIVIGKTTTSELGCKAVGDSPLTGFTRSPWDLSKTAGGSSAGAAASVAAGVTPVALGYRWWRFDSNSCCTQWPVRLQGAIWPGSRVSAISHAQSGPRGADLPVGERCCAHAAGDLRP